MSQRCPVCGERAYDYWLTPDNEVEVQCPHCGSVHIRRGDRWVLLGSLYPWRSLPLRT